MQIRRTQALAGRDGGNRRPPSAGAPRGPASLAALSLNKDVIGSGRRRERGPALGKIPLKLSVPRSRIGRTGPPLSGICGHLCCKAGAWLPQPRRASSRGRRGARTRNKSGDPRKHRETRIRKWPQFSRHVGIYTTYVYIYIYTHYIIYVIYVVTGL